MADIRIFNPGTIHASGMPYSHVAEAPAGTKLVAIAGQVPTDREGRIVGSGDFERQAAQVFANLEAALEAAGGSWGNVVQFMSFLTRREDIEKFMIFRRREFARIYPTGAYPPNTLVIVSGLVSEEFFIEVQALAAI